MAQKVKNLVVKTRNNTSMLEEIERHKIREAGKTQRKHLTAAIQVFEQRERPHNPSLYYALPTKFIQTELCGIPTGGRDSAQGIQLALLSLLEEAGSNVFKRANAQGKVFSQAYRDVQKIAKFLKRVFEGETPKLN